MNLSHVPGLSLPLPQFLVVLFPVDVLFVVFLPFVLLPVLVLSAEFWCLCSSKRGTVWTLLILVDVSPATTTDINEAIDISTGQYSSWYGTPTHSRYSELILLESSLSLERPRSHAEAERWKQ